MGKLTTTRLPPAGTYGFNPPRFARTLFKGAVGISHFLARVLGDRMKVQGRPLLLLTTIGAKSGEPPREGLARFPDPDNPASWLVLGSGAGSARHPAWCYNLVANPDQARVSIGKNELKVRAELLEPAARAKAWRMVVYGTRFWKV